MSISDGRGMFRTAGGRGPERVTVLTLVLLAGVLVLGACGGESAPQAGTNDASSSAAGVAAAPAAEEPATVADIFPEGNGRQTVLNNCASCHAVACTAIGQRSDGRWSDLREAHREHVPTLSEAELTAAFAYLQANFGANRPEPNVPARFLEGGCTPF